MIKIIFLLLIILINKSIASEYSYINDFRIEYKNDYIKNITTKNDDESYNAIIEIPSGTNQKWEISDDYKYLELEFKNGYPRIIKYLGYPANYGFIPNTKLKLDEGGDGDAIDVLVINDSPIEKGEKVKIKVIGMLKLLDKNEIDYKIISVKVGSIFEKINSLKTLENELPGILEIFSIWFQNYKGEKIKILGFEDKKKAKKFIERFVN